jgi:hypothetical protein
MAERERPNPDARVKLIAAWAGAALTVVAIVGFIAAPGARVVWIVLLVFGVATIPQVLLWRPRPSDQPETIRRQRR